MLWDLSQNLNELKYVLIDLERHPHHSFARVKKPQRERLLKTPLTLINRLTSILENDELLAKLLVSGGRDTELFLAKNVGDVKAMVIYPEYLIDMLGTVGVEQPMTAKLQMLIDQLEYLRR